MKLIWSNEHRMWWRANRSGYTSFIEEAGRYSDAEAADIVRGETADGRLWHENRNPVTGETYAWQSEYAVPAPERDEDRPQVITLCGSTRFRGFFERVNYDLTMAGHIVISLGAWLNDGHPAKRHLPSVTNYAVKASLDDLHKRKIDLSDSIYVINPGGYIGESTRSEIDYAEATGKRVEYMEALASPTREAAHDEA